MHESLRMCIPKVAAMQTEAPIWHPCTVHQACLWAKALAATRAAPLVRAALKADLGGRSDKIEVAQRPSEAGDGAQPSDVWRSSWEAFVGSTKEQLISWAHSVAAAKVRMLCLSSMIGHGMRTAS